VSLAANLDLHIREGKRHGLLVDTNLIILLVVGAAHPSRIPGHRATARYHARDFERVYTFVGMFPRRVTLPHVLAEASNMLDDGTERELLRTFAIDAWDEMPIASRTAAARRDYSYLGLADAAMLECCASTPFLLFTDDGQLVHEALRLKRSVISFELLRKVDGER